MSCRISIYYFFRFRIVRKEVLDLYSMDIVYETRVLFLDCNGIFSLMIINIDEIVKSIFQRRDRRDYSFKIQ